MNVALFTNQNSAAYTRNNNHKPETAGSIAVNSKPTQLFKRNDSIAIASKNTSVETAGSIACSTTGLGGQAQTSSAGGSLSVAA